MWFAQSANFPLRSLCWRSCKNQSKARAWLANHKQMTLVASLTPLFLCAFSLLAALEIRDLVKKTLHLCIWLQWYLMVLSDDAKMWEDMYRTKACCQKAFVRKKKDSLAVHNTYISTSETYCPKRETLPKLHFESSCKNARRNKEVSEASNVICLWLANRGRAPFFWLALAWEPAERNGKFAAWVKRKADVLTSFMISE